MGSVDISNNLLPVLLYIKNYRTSKPVSRTHKHDLTNEIKLASHRAGDTRVREIRMKEIMKQNEQDQEKYNPCSRTKEKSTLSSNDEQQLVSDKDRRNSCSNEFNSRSRVNSSDSLDKNVRSCDGPGKNAEKQLKRCITEMDEKLKETLVKAAQLDNEKTCLQYHLDVLNDDREETECILTSLQKQTRETQREYEQLQRDLIKLRLENEYIQKHITKRDELIKQHGLVLIDVHGLGVVQSLIASKLNGQQSSSDVCNSNSNLNPDLVMHDQSEDNFNQSLDLKLRRHAKEKKELLCQIDLLSHLLQEAKHKNELNDLIQLDHDNSIFNCNVKNSLNTDKQLFDYKFRLQISEREIKALQSNLARIDGQLNSCKEIVSKSGCVESELKAQNRKIQRELREKQSQIQEFGTANSTLQKRIEKLKATSWNSNINSAVDNG